MAEQKPPTSSAAGSSPQRTTGGKAPKPKTPAKRTRLQKLIADPALRGRVPDDVLKAQRPDLYDERIRRRIANPAERSKVPDSMLPADLLAKRQANAYNSASAAPGSSYTNHQLNDVIARLERQQFGDQDAAINTRDTSIPGWFQAYRSQVDASRQAQAQAAQAQVASLQQMAATAAGDTGQINGAPMDAEGAQRAQAAAQIRSAGIGNQAALAQNQGSNEADFLRNLGVLSYGQQAAALQDLADQKRKLAQDKGDFRVTQRSRILSDEADSALKSALTEAQIGTQQASAAATKASTTKTQTETQRSQADQDFFAKNGYYPATGKPKAPTSPDAGPTASEAAKHGYTSAQWKKLTPERRREIIASDKKAAKGAPKDDKPTSGPGSITSAAESKIVSQISKVYAALANPTVTIRDANGNPTVKPSTAAEVLKQLRAQNVDPRVLNVARSLLSNNGKGIGDFGVENAHDLGIHIGGHWKVIK